MTGTAQHATAAEVTRRLMIALAVMSATLLQVLDTTIVNVSLPHMQGELGATSDQISWVLTSYLVSAAICMPLTGYLADVLGRKRFLLICISGFVIASALCGISRNLDEIVGFRLLQGIFGAALVPLSQAIMSDAYPPEQRGRAMAIWGMGVMVGPVLGPTVGGWLTEVASWRWTFYINVPIGVVSLLLAWRFVEDTARRARRMDWIGFALLASGIAALQYLLDRGNHQDWWSSADIRAAAVISVAGVGLFIAHSIRRGPLAIFDVGIFRDRNFAMSCLIMMALGLGMLGSLTLQPILLEALLGYPVVTAGLVMGPRALAIMFSMMIVGRLVSHVEPRLLVAAGIMISALGTYAMTSYSLDVGTSRLIWPTVVQGLGLGLIFVPLSTVAYATLGRARMAEAAGIYSLLRTIGAAVGISIVTTVMTRQTQVISSELGAQVTAYNGALLDYLDRLHLTPADPAGLAIVAHDIGRQAQLGALLDAFLLVTCSYLVLLPVLLLLDKADSTPERSVPVME
jgi:MFS transporter, DHA2 family, multidrug resistance protein